MSLVRVHNFSISLDGFGPVRDRPRTPISATLGTGCTMDVCHRWWQPGGSGGVDDASSASMIRGSVPRSWVPGSSVTPDGARIRTGKAPGPQPAVPYAGLRPHASSSARPSRWRVARRSTSSTLRPPMRSTAAREAADGQDVRLGGGPTVIREFLAAGLVDYLHTVVVPILLGRGVPLWSGIEGLESDYTVEATASPSGVTHVTFTRAGV